MKESLSGRAGGAVTLAIGMAKIFSDMPAAGGGAGKPHTPPKYLMTITAYLYHFVIMFEALFILTLLETGTRVARFILQDTLLWFSPQPRRSHEVSWTLNVTASVVVCGLWGYLLYNFEIEPLWLMNGIGNQLLAVIGLALGTTYLLQRAPKRVYALCTGIPFVVVGITVFTAGVESVNLWWLRQALPTVSADERFTCRLMSVLVSFMIALGGLILIETGRRWYLLLAHGAAADRGTTGGRGVGLRHAPERRRLLRRWHRMSWKHVFARKNFEMLLAKMAGEHRLRRILGPVSLTSLGVGCIIGAGIFVLTGVAAADYGGPAIILSFAVAAVGCAWPPCATPSSPPWPPWPAASTPTPTPRWARSSPGSSAGT